MQIDNMTVYDIQERMGYATEFEARIMLGILSHECVIDTEDIPEKQWLEWCEQAVAQAKRETE